MFNYYEEDLDVYTDSAIKVLTDVVAEISSLLAEEFCHTRTEKERLKERIQKICSEVESRIKRESLDCMEEEAHVVEISSDFYTYNDQE